MATITFTVGSNARQYTDIVAAWAAIPTDVVGSGNSYVFELYNDSEFVHSAKVTLSGKTTDANHTITIRPAAGQGYANNANAATNALRYNQANGVGLKSTHGGGDQAFLLQNDWLTVDGLQFNCTANDSGYNEGVATAGFSNIIVKNCIIEFADAGPNSSAFHLGSGQLLSSLVVLTGASSDGVRPYNPSTPILAENVTVVRLPSLARTSNHYGFLTSGNISGVACSINNCAVFGAEFYETGYSSNTVTNCASDGTLTATNCLQNVTAASAFVDPTTDLRTKAGSPLIDAGTTPSINNTTAPTGNRQQGSAADIGMWEYPSAIVAPAAIITAKTTSGNTVTLSGTTTGSPTSGLASLAVTNMPYNGAVAQSPIALTLGSGTFTVTFNNVHIGTYDPTVTISTSAYPNVPATNNVGSLNVTDGLSAAVTQDPVDGQVLTLHGTYTGTPSSGTLTVPAAATNPNGAADQVITFTPANGTYSVSATLVPGNYDAPRLTLTDPNGTTFPQGSTSPITVLSISGNPQAGGGSGTTPTTHTVTITMVGSTGALAANLTGLKWAWFDQTTPDAFAVPTDKGVAATTDGNGVLTLTLTNSTLSTGATGWLVVTDSTGSVSGTYKAFSGPVVVS